MAKTGPKCSTCPPLLDFAKVPETVLTSGNMWWATKHKRYRGEVGRGNLQSTEENKLPPLMECRVLYTIDGKLNPSYGFLLTHCRNLTLKGSQW